MLEITNFNPISPTQFVQQRVKIVDMAKLQPGNELTVKGWVEMAKVQRRIERTLVQNGGSGAWNENLNKILEEVCGGNLNLAPAPSTENETASKTIAENKEMTKWAAGVIFRIQHHLSTVEVSERAFHKTK